MKMTNSKRVHPAAIFVSFFSTLKGLIIPIILAFFVGGTSDFVFLSPKTIILLVILVTFIYSFFQWLTFRYSIENGELQVMQGILVKKNRYVRREKVVSVDIVSGFIQRLFQLVKVRIETAGGGTNPEVLLIAISKKEAASLREELLDQENTVKSNELITQLEYRWKLPKFHLLVTALTSSGIGIVLSAFLAIVTQMEGMLPETIYDRTFGYFASMEYFFLIIGLAILVILAWLISIIITVMKYGGFQVQKKKNKLFISRGLLEIRQLTLDENRITAIRVVSNLLRQPFGYATVYVESAGGGLNEEQMSTILLPLIKKKDINKLFSHLLPSFSFECEIKGVPRKAFIRYQFRVMLLPIIGMFLLLWLTPFGYYALIVLPIVSVFGYLQFLDAGYGINEQYIWLRFRKISQSFVIVPKRKIQAMEYEQSILQKRTGLAMFQLSILSSIFGKRFQVLYLAEESANKLFKWYTNKDTCM